MESEGLLPLIPSDLPFRSALLIHDLGHLASEVEVPLCGSYGRPMAPPTQRKLMLSKLLLLVSG